MNKWLHPRFICDVITHPWLTSIAVEVRARESNQIPQFYVNEITYPFPGLDATLHWRHNGRDSVSNHLPHDCLLNRFFRRRSKKTSKFRITGLCVGNSPGTSEFPILMASYAENVSIWLCHHGLVNLCWQKKKTQEFLEQMNSCILHTPCPSK